MGNLPSGENQSPSEEGSVVSVELEAVRSKLLVLSPPTITSGSRREPSALRL